MWFDQNCEQKHNYFSALNSNMAEIWHLLSSLNFRVANLLSWTDFTLISDSKVVVEGTYSLISNF